MENQPGNSQGENKGFGFRVFATKRIIVAAVLIILVVWVLGVGLDSCGSPDKTTGRSSLRRTPAITAQNSVQGSKAPSTSFSNLGNGPSNGIDSEEVRHATAPGDNGTANQPQAAGGKSITATSEGHAPAPVIHDGTAGQDERGAGTQPHTATEQTRQAVQPKGVAFVEAVIEPIDYELNKRFWGWRPNDILNFTDNINNFQLGVLEVTRRSVVMLAERISRTGSTDAFDQHLEDAANWLMVTATRYWFPSPESKYKECIKELNDYKEQLIKGSAAFHTRTDNLIPLLLSYEDLLGSCDENLVKRKNLDGTPVTYFKADDYFFYAKGVASAVVNILEAVHTDFLPTLESRHGTELLHHALISCRQAAELSPLLITDTDLDGIFANHRANMAARISHARFYIGQLIKTLST